MYKLNTPKLVRQMTAPHRRTPKRRMIAEVLLVGLTLLWKSAEEQYQEDLWMARYVPQKLVIEYHCSRLMGVSLGIVTVELDVIPGTEISGYIFHFPANLSSEKIEKLYNLLRTLNITNYYEARY